jgi:hypothetical protein
VQSDLRLDDWNASKCNEVMDGCAVCMRWLHHILENGKSRGISSIIILILSFFAQDLIIALLLCCLSKHRSRVDIR